MKKHVLVAALCAASLHYSIAAKADDRLVRFDGGIGEIPVSTPGTANVVKGALPGGQPWVISRLSADVRTDGSISVDGRGLLLAGGNLIGTNGGLSVRAMLFCRTASFTSDLVALEANGDFRIDGMLNSPPPNPCDTPTLLIVNAQGRWFAAGILHP